VVATLSDGHKVKRRILHMRACNEKDAKGKLCCGHLKRWDGYGDEIRQRYGESGSGLRLDGAGADPEIYRCERCKTLYVPAEGEPARTRTLSF
jgi:hypothetical protein